MLEHGTKKSVLEMWYTKYEHKLFDIFKNQTQHWLKKVQRWKYTRSFVF